MSRVRLAAGFALGLAVPAALGEIHVRWRPPTDIVEYLGDEAPLRGAYRADPALGADYVAYEALRAEYADRLAELGPLDAAAAPTWAWFGNSFVQAPGMLGDAAQAALPRHRMFYLKRNEPMHLRVAQARQLLEAGLRAERILFVVLPLDAALYGARRLASLTVNPHGAITWRPRMPAPALAAAVAGSRLAFVGWVRSGRHADDPAFRPRDVMTRVAPSLRADLRAQLGALSEAARRHAVPVTLVLVPNREQILGSGGFALQDALADIGGSLRMDVFDARAVFAEPAARRDLFLPDWHFSPEGNRRLVAAILDHLRATGAAAPGVGSG
jgi:hypothetical protein